LLSVWTVKRIKIVVVVIVVVSFPRHAVDTRGDRSGRRATEVLREREREREAAVAVLPSSRPLASLLRRLGLLGVVVLFLG